MSHVTGTLLPLNRMRVTLSSSHTTRTRRRCERVQTSYLGCMECSCAYRSICTQSDLGMAECSSCQAWSTDLCDIMVGKNSILPYLVRRSAQGGACLGVDGGRPDAAVQAQHTGQRMAALKGWVQTEDR